MKRSQVLWRVALERYVEAVQRASGRITEECEDLGFALEWLTSRHFTDLGGDEASLVQVHRMALDLAPRVAWFHHLPVECCAFLLTLDPAYLEMPLGNASVHLRSLRSYTLECLYFVMPWVRFDDPRLLKATEHNLLVGHWHSDMNGYLFSIAKGSDQAKSDLFEAWEGRDWRLPEIVREFLDHCRARPPKNPFMPAELDAVRCLLDLSLEDEATE